MLLFAAATFAVTWIVWALSASLSAPSGAGVFGVRGPLFLTGVFAPGLVALALTAYAEGRTGVSRLLSRIGQWEVGARWYVFALSYMAAVKLTAAVIHRGVTGAWPAFGEEPWLLMLAAIPVSTLVQAGEEIGWRGYALPRLAARLGLGGASLVVGMIWAVWHLPLFFMAGTDSAGQSFPLYLLAVTPISVAIAWLYWKTDGSLLLVMLMHASINNTTGLVPGYLPGATDVWSFRGSFIAWASVGVMWSVAAILLLATPRREHRAPGQRGSTGGGRHRTRLMARVR